MCDPFIALTLSIGKQKRIQPVENPLLQYQRFSSGGFCMTQSYLE